MYMDSSQVKLLCCLVQLFPLNETYLNPTAIAIDPGIRPWPLNGGQMYKQ